MAAQQRTELDQKRNPSARCGVKRGGVATDTPPLRRTVAFGLRALLLLIALFAGSLGLLGHERRKIAQRREILVAAGWVAEHIDPQPAWRTLFLGDDWPRYVVTMRSSLPLTDDGLKTITGLPSLRTLVLNSTLVSDDGLAHLRSMPALESLDLCGNAISGAGLSHLSCLPHLQMLDLSHTAIEDGQLNHLEDLQELEVLKLSGTAITDDGFAHVSGLVRLENLSLTNTKISDAGLVHLRKLTNLKLLHLDNTRVAEAGAKSLKRALRGCVVVWH